MYNQCGYIEIVSGHTEASMQAAVDEVKALDNYSVAEGEVLDFLCFYLLLLFCTVSGSLPMPGMIPLLMLTTQLFHASLES